MCLRYAGLVDIRKLVVSMEALRAWDIAQSAAAEHAVREMDGVDGGTGSRDDG